jgi:formamidopyrimidine-DNA glycosylase
VLSLAFDTRLTLLIHLKLSGQISIHHPGGSRVGAGHPTPRPTDPYPHRATHVTFRFEDGTIAYFSDVRQFGWLRLMPSGDAAAALAAFRFGPEGTGDLDVRALGQVFAKRTIPVKTLLLDQTFIAGLGNIYVDEVLFRARVHPARAANILKPRQVHAVIEAIPPVLAEGIAQGGATIINHRAHPIDGFPAVHARAGEPCFACGTTIVKIRVGARGTYYCPRCQRLPRPERRVIPAGA